MVRHFPGGFAPGSGEALASAELYDPISESWTATGSMVAPRGGDETATLLSDGKVLVGGGFSSGISGEPLASAELYDPGIGTWTAIGDMSEARDHHTATLLPDGKVLMTGGSSNVGGTIGALASAELYNPGSGN